MMELSIVSTLYRSAAYLDEFHARISTEARRLTDSYEIVLVNDGCPEESLAVALRLQAADPHVVIIDLSRNFGHHLAMMAGLAQATGERIFLIDSDLEEPPELLGIFAARFAENDCDVVYGVQTARKGGWFERTSGSLFYALFNWLTSLNMPKNILISRLMSRRYVDALLRYEERELYIAGLWHIVGFEQVPIAVTKASKGVSTYTLRKKIALFVNSVTSFSDKPLVYIFYIGTLISLTAAASAAYVFYRQLVYDDRLSGWTSLIVSVWFLGGLVILFLGVIGIYLSKVFVETKRRPTIVRQIYRRTQ